ncbi:hypothetical protein VTL71DRAFT_1425 [Oculimacula yallundae]|uniref:Uncharacterized protein n=1 Tax=Oculimacula yallundae TaxID=86028 RepID=A0ABR4CAP9_9HELO
MKKIFGRVFNAPSKDSRVHSGRDNSDLKLKSKQDHQLSSSQHADHLWDTVMKLTKPLPKRKTGTPPKTKTITIPSTSNPPLKPVGGDRKRTSKATSPASKSIRVLPPTSPSVRTIPLPSATQKDIFYKGKGKPLQSSRDSKFSSISSLPSLKTLSISPSPSSRNTPSTSPAHSLTELEDIEIPNVILSSTEFTHLKSRLRRIRRRLAKQVFVTSNLSTNLCALLIRRECLIQNQNQNQNSSSGRSGSGLGSSEGAKRILHSTMMQVQTQNQLALLVILRTQLARLFARKVALMSCTREVVDKLESVLGDVEKEAVENIPEACSSRLAEEVKYVVGKEDLRILEEGVEKGIEGQRGVDGEIRGAVGEGVQGVGRGGQRRKGSLGEKVMMGRFVGFVEERLGVLGGVYVEIEGLLDSIREVSGKKDEGLVF